MAVFYPGISERVFEFGFNAEFCSKNKAVLASSPYIPTQNLEKKLGYDVKVIFQKGAWIKPLYLQHKVARYVNNCTSSNQHFYDAIGGNYFAFTLDTAQYNLIHRASQKKTREFYYCAPSFTSRKEMDAHYMNNVVINNSVWIDVSACGLIAPGDKTLHSLVYGDNSSQAFRFSERGIPANMSAPNQFQEDKESKWEKADLEMLRNTYSELFEVLKEWWPTRGQSSGDAQVQEKNATPAELPPKFKFDNLEDGLVAMQDITANYFGVSWVLAVKP